MISNLIKRLLLRLITLYQKAISPFLIPSCRFSPSCSQYTKDALEKKGLIKGLVASLIRILKCQPFHQGGWDPVRSK